MENNLQKKYTQGDFIEFKIVGIVLDSPYFSFDQFISDNINKMVKFLPGIISGPLCYYLKDFINSKIGIDLNKEQNHQIMPQININTALAYSEIDQLIPLKNFKNLINSYASKFKNKN